MVKRKYVIMKGIHDEYAFVFLPAIQHKFIRVVRQEPIAGGFVDFEIVDGKLSIRCYGKSISLGLKSRGEEDEKIIRETFDL